jgi:hypothetical protein
MLSLLLEPIAATQDESLSLSRREPNKPPHLTPRSIRFGGAGPPHVTVS